MHLFSRVGGARAEQGALAPASTGQGGRELGFVNAALGCDRARKLLPLARAKETYYLPWAESFAEEVRMVLG
eukprot:1418486-Pyramimonas_sp.AAC.1